MQRLLFGFFSIYFGYVLLLTIAEAKTKPLLIYFIDVEGGEATLLISPSGESLLIDAGNPGKRDADRIVVAAKNARVKRIDFLLITHFHNDHVGGLADLAEQIKVGTYVDHGESVKDSARTVDDYAAYEKLAAKEKRLIVKPGDGLPIKGLTVRILTANGEHIDHPLPNAGTANPWCESEAVPEVDDSENARSVGTLVTYGKFRFIDLGDLPKKQELELACPNNMIGTVDLMLVTHHGVGGSNTNALDWALHPRVAVVSNDAEDAEPAVWRTIRNSPGIEDFWQLHFATDLGRDRNVPEALIANIDRKSDGHYIKVSVEPDGSFSVFNSRNGNLKRYAK